MNTYDNLVVHAGVFHADDVLCAAVAKELYPDIKVTRTFNITDEMVNDEKTIICDIGKEYDPVHHIYDHHNDCPAIDGTDIKSSAIGLMLDDGKIRSDIEALNGKINEAAVKDMLKTIQALDNGLTIEYNETASTLSRAISSSNPVWDSKEDPNTKFNEAVKFAQEHFVKPCMENGELSQDDIDKIYELAEKNNILFTESKERAEHIVKDALENNNRNGVVTLPQFAPWNDVLAPSDALFVIYPSNRGGYNLQCVPPEPESFEKKLELPDWSDNKPDGMTFEHPAKFLASFETKEQAQNAAKQVVEQNLSLRSNINESKQDALNKIGVNVNTDTPITKREALNAFGDGKPKQQENNHQMAMQQKRG